MWQKCLILIVFHSQWLWPEKSKTRPRYKIWWRALILQQSSAKSLKVLRQLSVAGVLTSILRGAQEHTELLEAYFSQRVGRIIDVYFRARSRRAAAEEVRCSVWLKEKCEIRKWLCTTTSSSQIESVIRAVLSMRKVHHAGNISQEIYFGKILNCIKKNEHPYVSSFMYRWRH